MHQRTNALVFLAAMVLASGRSEAQQPAKPAVIPRSTRATGTAERQAHTEIDAAVKANAQAFAEAFNGHDAKGVAALWTEDGEYVDENGQKYAGRAEIEQQYAAFFAAYPNTKLTVVVDSVRPLGSSAAIEEGHTTLVADGKSEVSSARYTAIHAKVGDRWLMASVRDESVAADPAASQLQDLAWLIGSWSAEQNGGRIVVECRWLAENHFIERKYTATRGDQTVAAGTQIIGWNAAAGRIQSWTFTSDGGHATALWFPRRGGWVIENVGLTGDGAPTTAVNYFVKLNDNALVWKSVERTVGGMTLPDSGEITLHRSPASAP